MAWKTRSRIQRYVQPDEMKVTLPPVPEPTKIIETPAPEVPHMEKLQNYIDLVEIRERDIDKTKSLEGGGFLEGEDRWIWIKQDTGAWDGPANDWATQHKYKYFKHVRKFNVVVTAGANQGMYVRFYAKRFGMVYAFEPDPLNFHCMTINNQVDNVIKIQAALGEHNGFCTVSRNGFSNTGTWNVLELPTHIDGHQPIPIMSIDSMNFDELDLLQLDVEGYELSILKGAKKTIKKLKPVVILENGHTEPITKFMTDLGYVNKEQSAADSIWVPK